MAQAYQPQDVFTEYYPEPQYRRFAILGLILVVGLILIYNQIQSQSVSSYGVTYIPIILLLLILFLAAPSGYTNFVFFGKDADLLDVLKSVGIGLLIGTALVSGLFGILKVLNLFSIISLSLPQGLFSITTLGLTTTGVSVMFLFGYLVPLIEEISFSGALQATFGKVFSSPNTLPLVLFLGGIIYIGVFNAQSVSYVIGGILILTGMLLKITHVLKTNFSQDQWERRAVSILLMALFFASFHVTSYGGVGLQNAFFFAILIGIVNTWRQDIVSGIVTHATNNAIITAVTYGIPIWFAVLMISAVIITVLILFAVQKRGARTPSQVRSLSGDKYALS